MTKLKKKLPRLRRILNKDWETVLNVLTLLFITLAGAYMLMQGLRACAARAQRAP